MPNHKFPYMLKFARDGFADYISHLDWIRLVQVTLDRLNLSLVYTEGYSPKAKLKFSPPLPVGLCSDTELVLIYLRENIPENIIERMFENAMPLGLPLTAVRYLYPEPPKNPFATINGALYKMYFPMLPDMQLRLKIIDTLYGHNTLENTPEIISEQSQWLLKVLNEDAFIKGTDHNGKGYTDSGSESSGYIDYVARLESNQTFQPVRFAMALKDHLQLPHIPQGRKMAFLHIEPDSARKLFEF